MTESVNASVHSSRHHERSFVASFALVVAFSFGVIACGGDDDDDVSAQDAGGGSSGSSTGGGKATGGSSARGGSNGTGGASGGSGGKASLVPPDTFNGQDVFRHDTFGDEQFWTDTLRMHEAIQSALDPMTALSLGLKVDAEALPEGILDDADLTNPATTVALIGLNAVVGVKGTVDANGNLTRVGITCALCHSDVDDSVMEGIGVRIDGAANRDLDPGAIIALAPGLEGSPKLEVYESWGPGYYDPRFNQDGMNFPVLIPPIYGLADVPYGTYTGDGPISYWNSYVGITQMGGIGSFFDPRIDVSVAYDRDMIAAKLPALFDYEVSLEAPAPDDSAFDAAAAERGQALFESTTAMCSTCHTGPALSDSGMALHAAVETGMDPTTAERSATGMYRTTPLRALLAHPPYFHDGSAETLADVVDHYDTTLDLGLTDAQKGDLVEYLNSL